MTDPTSTSAQPTESGTLHSWTSPIIGSLLLLLPAASSVQIWLSDAPIKTWLAALAVISPVIGVIAWRFRRGLVLWLGMISAAVLIVVPAYLYGIDGALLPIAGVPFRLFVPGLFLFTLILAAWELARVPRLPLWARIIAPALALFATVPVVIGLMEGVPFVEVLVGLWTIPYWTQGAWFGAAVFIPIALIVSLLRAIIPAWRAEPFRKNIALASITVFVTTTLATGFTMTSDANDTSPAFANANASDSGQDSPDSNSTSSDASRVSSSMDSDFSAPGKPSFREQPASQAGSFDFAVPGQDWLETYDGLDLDALFNSVAQEIRYEPYRGVLRGAAGTALAKSGNSLDQSLLLASVLRRNGFRVRFVRGTLEGTNLEVVLRGMYPPEIPKFNFGADYAPYDPAADSSLLVAKDHFWVEVYQPDSWLPLDPSFPSARPGEAYAHALARYEEVPAEYLQRLKVSLKQELQGGEIAELGSHDEAVVNLGLRPLSLIIHRVPKSSADNDKKPRSASESIGGLGGSLAGGGAKKQAEAPAPKPVAVEYQRRLFVQGEYEPWASTLVAEQDRDGFIAREWLEFELTVPGSEVIRTEREIFRYNSASAKEPQAVRHYSISIVPGPINEHWLEAERTRVGAQLELGDWERELRKANRAKPGSKAAATIAPILKTHGDLAGINGGHLLGLTYALESDTMSRQVAWTNGVTLLWPIPRILITGIETESLESGGTESRVTLDLRLDRIQSIPYPGVPTRAAQLFQTGRGLQNTTLEGAVIAGATGLRTPVTTAVVMTKAGTDGTPLLSIGPANADALDLLERLPPRCHELIEAALDSGHDIIVPQRAASLAGRDRWGWWQVNRETGEVIGVMEDGQHQSSTNYTISLSKVGLDDDSGFAIGGIIGANSTLFVISGLMIKYGETSAAMISEVEKYVKSIMCSSCVSKAGASAGASGGVSAGNDCFSIEKKVEAEINVGAKVSFCESYQKGFSCASGLLLQGLRGGKGGAAATAGGQIGVSGQLNCSKGFAGIEASDSGYSVNGKNQIRD